MKNNRIKSVLSLLIALVMVVSCIPMQVTRVSADVNADSKDPNTGHPTTNGSWKYYPNAGVRVSIYWAEAAEGTTYEEISRNFTEKPDSVKQVGVTTDFMKKDTAPNYTVSFYSKNSIYQYMKEITVYPNDTATIAKRKKAANLTFNIQKGKYNYVSLDSDKMPTNLEKVDADDWVEWLTGQKVGDKYDDYRTYKVIETIGKKCGASWFTAEKFKQGIYVESVNGVRTERVGVYKLFYEPTISVVLNGSGSQMTARDLMAWGYQTGNLAKLATMKPLMSTVGDVAGLAYSDAVIGMTKMGSFSINKNGISVKSLSKGGEIFKKIGVSVIEPQRDNTPSPTVDVVKVVKSYVSFGLSDSDRELLTAMGKSGKPQKDIDAFLKNALGYKQIETVLETIPKSQLEIEVENTTRYVSEYGGTAYLNDIFTSGQDLTSTSEYKKDGYIDWTTELPTTGKTYFNVEPGVIWSYNLGMRTRAYYCDLAL